MGLADLQVMVVEDHGFQRRMALRMLGEIGVGTVHDAADGIAALDRLQRLPSPPDVVLVDLDMPGMDGVEFIGHVAQGRLARGIALVSAMDPALLAAVQAMARAYGLDRTSVVSGTRVSVRLALGGRRIIKKKQAINRTKINT